MRARQKMRKVTGDLKSGSQFSVLSSQYQHVQFAAQVLGIGHRHRVLGPN